MRRIYGFFFFILFIALLIVTNFKHLKGYETSIFLELSPLVAFTSLLTGWTLYHGLILSLLIIMPTLIFGRFFCSWVCPMGILNQWVSHIFNKRRAIDDYSVNSYRTIYRFKYYLLAVLLVLASLGAMQAGLFDPIAFLTRSFSISVLPSINAITGGIYVVQPIYTGGIAISLVFIAVMAANRFLTRFWCRVLCPLGAGLGFLSTFSMLRIRRDVNKCTDCQKCMRYCHGGCDPQSYLRVSECHLCMTCIDQCPTNAIHYGLPVPGSAQHTPVDVNRRRLIEAAVTGIILLPMMRSSLTAASQPQPSAIRPPGSLPERDFLSRCIKCCECMRVCPTRVLQPAIFEGGLEALWTPILVNQVGYCEYNCVLCGHVCPTGAIMPLTVEKKIGRLPEVKPTKIGTAFYDRGRCLPWAMNTDCIVCEEVCPTSPKAIWFEDVEVRLRDGGIKKLKRPFVDTKLCVGCGICENKCPVHDRPAVRVTSIGETRSTTNQMILKQ
ncbi:MAG: 4Fe-4S binding protein [Nitrospirae bacterium]|nr:4Fe-4S binding protein [Nitrospirota bacterium]